MDIKRKSFTIADDSVSAAEGQIEISNPMYRQMPDCLRHLSHDEVQRLNRKILRKIDLLVLPTIGILYILNYVDRQNLAAAKLQAQQVGNAFGGLLAAAILQLDGMHNIAGWEWLFIIEGSATVAIGAICACVMPEFPHNSRILSQLERDLAVWRIESEAGAAEGTENESVLRGFAKALSDPKLLLLIIANMLSQTQGSIANYFPTLVASLNFNNTISLLLTAPPYILAGTVYYVIMFYSDRRNTVYPIIMLCVAISIAMYIILMASLNVGARYFSMVILPFASVGPQLLLYKTANLHLARPVSKRAAASALVNAIGGTSNIWASYLYYAPPHFYAAFSTLMASAFLLAGIVTIYRWLVLRENERLNTGDPDMIAKVMKGGVTEEMVQLNWRYEMY
ncbi:major facilitator superfamily domain-containing protein [Aspergillus floccosus]